MGLEPTTLSLKGLHSTKLSYSGLREDKLLSSETIRVVFFISFLFLINFNSIQFNIVFYIQ